MKALKNPEVAERARFGIQHLSTEELISILTDIDVDAFKQANESILQAADGKKICETMELATYGELPAKKVTALQSMKFAAIMELVKRTQISTSKKINQIHGPEDVAHYLLPLFGNENKEHFVVLFLNTKHHIIKHEVISIGSLSASVVHPREVFEAACKNHAAAIIVAHNHPSGDTTPSREDIAVTDRLVKAGKIMDIPVLDHVIIGSNGSGRYCSLKEKGEIH